jgi:hypothetical protein
VDVDPLLAAVEVAGLDVPARVTRIGLAREPHRDGAAETGPPPPAAGADQLVARRLHGRPGARFGERAAFGQAIRTTGAVQVAGSSRRTPRWPSSDQTTSWQARASPAGTAPGSAT